MFDTFRYTMFYTHLSMFVMDHINSTILSPICNHINKLKRILKIKTWQYNIVKINFIKHKTFYITYLDST